MGRLLVLIGVSMVVVGGMFWLGGRMGLGSLPGDLRFDTQSGGSCFVPIASSIVISLLLTLVINIIIRLFR